MNPRTKKEEAFEKLDTVVALSELIALTGETGADTVKVSASTLKIVGDLIEKKTLQAIEILSD